MDDETTNAARLLGKRGGKTLAQRRGPDYFRKIGQAGGSALIARHGSEHMARIGALGGAVTASRYGAEHYQALGAKGAKKMKDLIKRGREVEDRKEGR